jgi:plasmid maintenance system killer protein
MGKQFVVQYAPLFVRRLASLPEELQNEVIEKIELLKNGENHHVLKVHKLKGALAGRYSVSINYRYRAVFVYQNKTSIILLTVGDHRIYH